MNKVVAACLLFWIVSCCGINTSAKAVLLNEDAGLTNIEVTAIAKDKNGLMWVGTKRGLSRYDGYRFVPIAYFEKCVIRAMVYDSMRNVMWVGTDIGLSYIHCDDYGVVQCSPLSRQNPVTCLLMQRQQVVVGFAYKYIMLIDPDFSCKVMHRFVTGRLLENCMVRNEKQDVFICLKPSNTILKIGFEGRQVSEIGIRGRMIDFLTIIEDDIYAAGVSRGFSNAVGKATVHWYIDTLNGILQDPECFLQHEQSIFIAYRNSTKVYQIHTSEHKISDLSVGNENVFNNKRIYCLFRDDFGVLWIGTSKGMIKFIPEKPKPAFEKLFWNQPHPLSARQMIEDVNGDLYIASYSGLFKYAEQTHTWKNWNRILYLGKNQPFFQRSLLNVNNRYVYIGADANYFGRFDKKTESVEKLSIQSLDGMCNSEGSVLTMEKDVKGKMWLGSEKGLLSFDYVSGQIACHLSDKYSVGESSVKFIYMLPGKRQFWAATEDGIFLVDIDRGNLLHLNDNTTPALTGKNVNAITADVDGNIWIATDEAGINVLSANHKDVYSITRKDGLSSNEVYHFLWQDSVRLWISTYNGLNYYHTQTKTIIPYYESDGITNNEFNQNSALKAADGKMYFGGINGITAFYPPKMETHQQPFALFVSGISKWEKSSGIMKDVIVKNDEVITMNPGDNSLTFLFAGTDYTHPDLNMYFYKIEGLHHDWIALGAQPSLRLESLQAGNYTLFIKATRGSRGVSSINTLTYHLAIKQVFYQTLWFYLLVAFGVASLIYFYFANRLKTQKKLELLRVKIASNLHDDVGSLLTRITMSADRLITRMPAESETTEKLKRVSDLSREANVAMSDVLWTIDARNDQTGSLTDRMREHAEDLLLPKGIDITIDFKEINHQQKVSPEFRQHLFLLFKEIINNIIKHSNAEAVDISYHQSGNHCVLRVKNDGVTEQLGTVSTGQGLRNIKMRAELLNGNVEIRRANNFFEVMVVI